MSRVILMMAVCSALVGGLSTNLDAREARWLRYPAISPDGSAIVFTYRGDLWTVPSAGGKATPLTLHEAYDTSPVWSRDGSMIAFASDRYGNFDAWVMPAEGGEATRLTYHSASDTPTAFTPGDSAVLFSSTRMDSATNVQFPTGAQPELHAVSLAGAEPTRTVWCSITDRNAHRRLSISGRTSAASSWRLSDQANRSRTALSRASMVASATSA